MFAIAVFAVGLLAIGLLVSARQSALFLVGALAGVVLYHAAFGFTSSWRDFIAHGRGAGVRAQMVMLGVTTAVFVPLITHGADVGLAVRGSVAPAGVPVIAGAFLFGIGMQLDVSGVYPRNIRVTDLSALATASLRQIKLAA